MLVYGKNVLKELDKKKIKKVYVSRKDYYDYLIKEKIKYEMVNNNKLDNMINGNHQGIVIEIDDFEYKTLNDVDSDFVVILDHLEDPYNFGAIIRSCACAGVKDIIIPKNRSVSVNETVMKVSAGTLNKVNIIKVSNIVNSINYLKDKNYFIYSSDMDGIDYRKVDFSEKKVLVIGNEGTGVSRLVKENCDEIISIKMVSETESLNASVAAGILIFGMRD